MMVSRIDSCSGGVFEVGTVSSELFGRAALGAEYGHLSRWKVRISEEGNRIEE
jgi:hypothetical protein